MAERTGRMAAKQPLTPTLWILIVVVLIALVGGGLFVVMSLLGDEPPIRVRNGSMNIELDREHWVDNGNGWSPSAGRPSGTHAVEVRTAGADTCPAQDPKATWQVVSIMYSDKVRILLTPSASSNTVVTPKSELANPSNAPRLLQHGAPGAGYIEQIELRGGGKPWSCTFTDAGQLSVINICPGLKPGC
jgi:hypothetical protein